MRSILLALTLAACAPSLVTLAPEAIDARDDGAVIRADAPAEAADASERPDVAPDAAQEAAAPDAAPDVAPDDADGREDSATAPDVTDAAEVAVDPCGGSCVSAPNAATLECIAGGGCVVRTCAPGFADCNRASADGCETNITTRFDCGACNRRCGSGSICTAEGCR